ncbi:MAG: heme-binding domain-containing protein [Bacteroidia bacterium]|nr:heme-binding domain-containing protein [Bacteroidia bacterium]
MKKLIKISAILSGALFLAALTVTPVSAQTNQKPADQKAIPADVMKVFDKSCAACHKDPGMKFAQGPFNISTWDNYSPEKQAAKAKTVCNFATKGKMPPKKYQANNPGAVPTKDDIKILCDWAATLNPVSK